MSKQPDIYEQRDPSDSPPNFRHKEDGDDSNSGSFYDQADMQRLGKEQELKVCSSRSQHLGRECDFPTTIRFSNETSDWTGLQESE